MTAQTTKPPTWAICTTIKADKRAILDFAAYHLEAGAHRIFIYLDAPNPEALPILKAHPKIRVITCDADYWSRRKQTRPEKHQVRQTSNATRAYRRQAAQQADWLIHIDVDEFLWADRPIAEVLRDLPAEAICARIRPIESLAGSDTGFKTLPPGAPGQSPALERVYPQFGRYVRGGFLSHINGKVFVRTGYDGMKLRIHNAYLEDIQNPCQVNLPSVDLCHFHAKDWESWLAHYRYRLQKGSYRASLGPNRPVELGGINMHDLLSRIEAENGQQGLRDFYDEICADSPALRSRLQAENMLKIRDLRLNHLRALHFPESA